MLPSSKTSLQKGGSSPRAAAWILIACFLFGVFGIQIFSRMIHHFMPSHTVGCDHSHGDDPEMEQKGRNDRHKHRQISTENDDDWEDAQEQPTRIQSGYSSTNERTPLLARAATDSAQLPEIPEQASMDIRPTLQSRVTTRVANFVSGPKPACDVKGPCLGYSDPCGSDCFKKVNLRGGLKAASLALGKPKPMLKPSYTWDNNSPRDEEAGNASSQSSRRHTAIDSIFRIHRQQHPSDSSLSNSADSSRTRHSSATPTPPESHHHKKQHDHHHHIPTNAFLAISLQTSIAIALHKLPEGFITYATNHANPHLAFSIFVALFIHNLSEGFALALPIFLASGSRIRALLWSSLLGGASQPLGAGIAAAWLALAEKSRGDSGAESGISEGVYGGMFAVTAGIMATVGLSLLREGLELGHDKGLCMVWAFVGMGILGVSGALTA